MDEDQGFDRKSLRLIQGRRADWSELACVSVCFANASGGRILLGVEDGASEPPAEQRIEPGLLDKVRKRVGELTVNVQALPTIQRAANGGEFIALTVARSTGVASTSDGRYFLRVVDDCMPILGDDVLRLANERPHVPWETMTALGVPVASAEEPPHVVPSHYKQNLHIGHPRAVADNPGR